MLITQNFYFFTLLGRPRIPDPDDFGIEYLAYSKSSGEAFFLEEHPEPYFGKGLFVQKYYKRVSKLLNKSDLEDNPVIRIFYLK